MNTVRPVVSTLALAALSTCASAIVVPYVETFDGSAAQWSKSSVFTPLTYVGAGGPDGSAYATLSTNFAANMPGDIPILFRGQSNFNSSANAFVGNWITSGVTAFTFSVRHNGSSDFTFFARFAPSAGPGVVWLAPTVVAPNQWVSFSVPISNGPQFIYEGTNFNIFSVIARTQVGVMLDGTQAGNAQSVTFDIDNVGIVPAPAGGLALLGAAAIVGRRRR